jgi:hypothetical protein
MQFINVLLRDYDPKGTGVLRADDIPTALGTAVVAVHNLQMCIKE